MTELTGCLKQKTGNNGKIWRKPISRNGLKTVVVVVDDDDYICNRTFYNNKPI